MPSDALNALIAAQKSGLGNLMPSATDSSGSSSSAKKTFATRQAAGVSKNSHSDFHNYRAGGTTAGLASPNRDRVQAYEEKALEALEKRKEEEANRLYGGKKKKTTQPKPKSTAGMMSKDVDEEGLDEPDFDPNNGREVIERCFTSIGGVKAFTSFQRLSTEEQECIEILAQYHTTILQNASRDLHLNELLSCITGNELVVTYEKEESDSGEEDDEFGVQKSSLVDVPDEAIGPQAFSQYHFYDAYIRDLVFYPDKFDFLLRCIENSVVKVAQPSRFISLIERIAARGRVDPLPDQVVNFERLLEEDEEKRLESFTLKKDWVCQVPHYLSEVGDGPLPPVTTVDGKWNHKDTAPEQRIPDPNEVSAYDDESLCQAEGNGLKSGVGTSSAPAVKKNPALDPNFVWKRLRVPKTRATEDDKELKISNFEFSSNRRRAVKNHALTYPMMENDEGECRLPADGEWTKDKDNGLYWCPEFELYFDGESGQYYDPNMECWYWEELDSWFAVGN